MHDVVRIRLADGAPISLEHARFPAARFPDLLEQSLGGSIYELLAARYGVEPAEAEEQIEVVEAAGDEAAVLGTAPGAALLAITRTTRDDDGVPLEFSYDLFRADRTAITVRTRGPRGTALSAGARAQAPGRARRPALDRPSARAQGGPGALAKNLGESALPRDTLRATVPAASTAVGDPL